MCNFNIAYVFVFFIGISLEAVLTIYRSRFFNKFKQSFYVWIQYIKIKINDILNLIERISTKRIKTLLFIFFKIHGRIFHAKIVNEKLIS